MTVAKQIHEYPLLTTLQDEDILLVQQYISPGVYETKCIKVSDAKIALQAP